MPCNSIRETQQSLIDIKDIKLLAAGLTEMGFTVYNVGPSISFSGVVGGRNISGSYNNGVLTNTPGLDVTLLKKYVGVANLKKNAKKSGWTLKADKTNPFKFTVTK